MDAFDEPRNDADVYAETETERRARFEAFVDRRIVQLNRVSVDVARQFAEMCGRTLPINDAQTLQPTTSPLRALNRGRPIIKEKSVVGGRDLFQSQSSSDDAHNDRKEAPPAKKRKVSANARGQPNEAQGGNVMPKADSTRRKSSSALIKPRDIPEGKKLYERFSTIAAFVEELQTNRRSYFPDPLLTRPALLAAATDACLMSNAEIFSGVKAVFVSRSPKLMAVGRAHLKIKLFIKHGGIVQNVLQPQPSAANCTTHLILLEDSTSKKPWTFEEVPSVLKVSLEVLDELIRRSSNRPNPVKIVSDEWISNSSFASVILPEQTYELRRTPSNTHIDTPVLTGPWDKSPFAHIVPLRDLDVSQDSQTESSNLPQAQHAFDCPNHSSDNGVFLKHCIVQEAVTIDLDSPQQGVDERAREASYGTSLDSFDDLAEFIDQAAAEADSAEEIGKDEDDLREQHDFTEERKANFYSDLMIHSEKPHEEDTDEEQILPAHAKHTSDRPKKTWKYQCEKSNVAGERAGGVNDDIVAVLKKLKDKYEADGDHWRNVGMQKAIGILRNSKVRIATVEQARAIPGIGAKNAQKIAEIAHTGSLRRLKMTELPEDKYTKLFVGIWGVGAKIAKQWFNQGARTLGDLLPGNRFGIQLSTSQLLCLQHYDDLKARIPRQEAEAMYAVIRRVGNTIDDKLQIELMGSYRRGQADCGDIDIIITRDPSDGNDHKGMVRKLVEALSKEDLVFATLSAPTEWDALDAKWMGLCHINNGRTRHMDILAVPFDELGASLIYFTGNDIFNRSLRLKARHMGYSLNQKGLFKNLLRDPKTKLKVTQGQRIAGETEESIFNILGVKWRPPTERLP